MAINSRRAMGERRVDHETDALMGLPLLVEDARVCATPREGSCRSESAQPSHGYIVGIREGNSCRWEAGQ